VRWWERLFESESGSVENGGKEGFHLRRIVRTELRKCSFGREIRFPIKRGVTGAANLHVFDALACFDQSVHEFRESAVTVWSFG
jgi:hypothetical protein